MTKHVATGLGVALISLFLFGGVARADTPAFPNAVVQATHMVAAIERSARELRLDLRASRRHDDEARTHDLSDRVNQVDVAARRARLLRDNVVAATHAEEGKQVWRAILELGQVRDRATRLWKEVEQADEFGRSSEGTTVVVIVDPKIPEGGLATANSHAPRRAGR